MLKILILTHRFSPDVGGIETNSEILANAFSTFGAEVHLLKEHNSADVVFENNP